MSIYLILSFWIVVKVQLANKVFYLLIACLELGLEVLVVFTDHALSVFFNAFVWLVSLERVVLLFFLDKLHLEHFNPF